MSGLPILRSPMNGRKLQRSLVVFALGGALAFGASCTQSEDPEPAPAEVSSRVLLVGIDGATFRVIDPLFREGRLPNLRRIAKNGVVGPLRSHFPLLSPRVWTSIATGKLPENHGILHWVRKNAEGALVLYQSADRKGHALWNIATDAGLTIGVVNWLNTYPIETVRGVVISDAALPETLRNREILFAGKKRGDPTLPSPEIVTFPAHWREKVAEIWEQPRLNTEFTNPFAAKTILPPFAYVDVAKKAWNGDDQIAKLGLAVEQEIAPDILMVLMPAIDKMSHFLWGGFDESFDFPEHLQYTPEQSVVAVDALFRTYEQADLLIGELMSRFGPEDLVVIVSDHGFESRVYDHTQTTGGHDTEEAVNGVIFARGAHIPKGERVEGMSVNDVTPLILAWLGIPVGEDMDGSVPDFLKIDAPPAIPTHDTGTIERASDRRPASEQNRMEELRALGYIEGDAPRE